MANSDDESLVESTAKLVKAVESFQSMRTPNTVGSSHVTINAGGIGIAAALIACALVIGFNLSLQATLSSLQAVLASHDRKIERMQDHLSAIYMQAPNLRPPPEKPKEKDH